MPTRDTLVVFYSRTGHTRWLAHALAYELHADLCELHEPRTRLGVFGYLRSAFEAGRGATGPLEPLEPEPTLYSRVVVGTPVWNASVSTPVRSFLSRYGPHLPELAFFLTEGGHGDARVFRQMEEASGHTPIATLALRADDVAHGVRPEALGRFVDELKRTTPPRTPTPREGPHAPGP
ncbi:MAG: hypothetical protein JST54_26405 [Deltaproteobacteria bacterium]|nr:hypothetical protein [Deltaproteobacteria bacterium]